jgi:hypothetical protein
MAELSGVRGVSPDWQDAERTAEPSAITSNLEDLIRKSDLVPFPKKEPVFNQLFHQ